MLHVPAVPSALVMALFVPVLLACAALPMLRQRWRATRGELVTVFCMLCMALPVLGAGFWQHFPSLLLEHHRLRHHLAETMMVSPALWPNHGNVLEGASVEDAGTTDLMWRAEGSAKPFRLESFAESGACVRLEHASADDRTVLRLVLAPGTAKPAIVPGGRYLISARIRLDQPGPDSSATLGVGAIGEPLSDLATVAAATAPELLAPDRFIVVGMLDHAIPETAHHGLVIELRFTGAGVMYARDVTMIDSEAAYRYFEGYEQSSAGVYEQLPGREQAGTHAPPEGLAKRIGFALWGRVPWSAWWRPLATWGVLLAAVSLGMFCLVRLFFRQWDEGERLTFPLQTFVLELTRGDEQGRPALLRSTPFLVGAGVTAFYLCMAHLSDVISGWPAMRLRIHVPELIPPGPMQDAIARAAGFARGGLLIELRPAFIALAFFVSLDLAMSIVIFYLLGLLYRVAAFFTPLQGMNLGMGRYGGVGGFPFDPLLMTGGLLFMACACVWAARKHLGRVLRSFLPRRAGFASSDVLGPERRALLGLPVALALMIAFALLADLNWVFVTVWLVLWLVMGLSAARIRAEAGLPYPVLLPLYPRFLMMGMGGFMVFGYPLMNFTAQTAFLYVGAFLLLMPVLAEAMYAARQIGVPLGKLQVCMAMSLALALVLGGVTYLSWAYSVGAAQMHPAVAATLRESEDLYYNAEKDNVQIHQYYQSRPPDAVLTDADRDALTLPLTPLLSITGVAFVLTALLALARTIWLGFPLHPLGFALAFSPAVYALWPSIAVGALVKRLGLHLGGVEFSRRTLRPLFVGLFVGDLLTEALWRCAAALTM